MLEGTGVPILHGQSSALTLYILTIYKSEISSQESVLFHSFFKPLPSSVLCPSNSLPSVSSNHPVVLSLNCC